jgi:drug/metabolite transporter (DMT)-like permease
MFLGGPLSFNEGLRRQFLHVLKLAPENAIFPEYARVSVALGAAIYAVVFMMKRFDGADTLSSVLIGCIIGAAAGLPWLVTETQFTPVTIGGILAIGIVQYGMGYICMAEGLMGTPPLTASLISMVEPIINPILAAIVIGELLSPMALTGAAIVIVSVILYNIAQEKLKDRAAKSGKSGTNG